MNEFIENRKFFDEARGFIQDTLFHLMKDNGIYVVAVESRVKDPVSLRGKLERKGHKYHSLSDITDIIGARIITFYSPEVDKVASIIAKTFDVDWDESIDKRKALAFDQFGYMSLHYICKIPKSLKDNPSCPLLNEIRFEIQMRTALQHVWSTIQHDFGYKTNFEVPKQYARKLVRLASLLEVADEEFSELITEIADYRRHIKSLISCGDLNEISLNGDSFKFYLESNPFEELNNRIASINSAEVEKVNLESYLPALLKIGVNSLGELRKMVKDFSEHAFQLAAIQLSQTDLDIVASSIGLRNLCVVYILQNGGGERGLKDFFIHLGQKAEHAERSVKIVMKYAEKLQLDN